MKKFVAVPAIIALVLVLSFNVQATAPIVDDIPDVRIIFGGAGVDDVFDLDDYVVDIDDGDAGVSWSALTSEFGTIDSPTPTIGIGNLVSISGLGESENGLITWSAEDTLGDASGNPQITTIDTVVNYSDFWLTRPTLTSALYAYDDTTIEVQPIYVVRNATDTLVSGGSLLTGSGNATANWTVNMRGLIDRTTYPLESDVAGVSTYGLTVSVDADGTFTLAPSLTEPLGLPLEIGFRAYTATTAPDDNWSGARVVAAQDILPMESNSGDLLKEHCFEGTGLSAIPNDNDGSHFMDVSEDYGWSAYYPEANSTLMAAYTAIGITKDAVCNIVTLASAELPAGPEFGPLPWGSCIEIDTPPAGGNRIFSAKYAYPDPGDTICLEFWVATDIPESISKEKPIFRGGISTTNPTHEISEFEAKGGKGSPLPFADEGWVKVQTFYTAQITGMTNVDHFRVILMVVRNAKDSTDNVKIYLDNFALYKVKSPIDVTNYRAASLVPKDALAYGATAIGMGSYDTLDELDGTFENTTSDEGNTVDYAICGIVNRTASVTGDNFNTLGDGEYTLAIAENINYTFAPGANKSLKVLIPETSFNYADGSPLSVVSLTISQPCDLINQGLNGIGYYGLTFWLKCDTEDYYQADGQGKYGHIPAIRYGVYNGGNVDPIPFWVFSKATSASAMPVFADGWKKFQIIYTSANYDVKGLMLATHVICGSLQGSPEAVYYDDITFHKVNDKVNYYDDSLFN
jgi:hypothetical protein